MKCKAVQVNAPNDWQFGEIDLPQDGGELIVVHHSSLCHTDCQIIDGSLCYYRDGFAKYPIIPGHEWCGTIGGQPVVGLCVIGCGKCEMCLKDCSIYCSDRVEVGVVNKNGGFADFLWLDSNCLVKVPDVSPKYALIEPLAVAIHGIRRLPKTPSKYDSILINGFGTIGKFCMEVCQSYGIVPEVRDPRISKCVDPRDFELLIECSGSYDSLDSLRTARGQTVLAFGFAYNEIEPGMLVANEIEFVGSLGSNRGDFVEAVSLLPNIKVPDFELAPLSKFEQGLKMIKQHCKTVFVHGGL